jgi:peptidoglycan hydrolase-like protein with peptidoglycan-binding domain
VRLRRLVVLAALAAVVVPASADAAPVGLRTLIPGAHGSDVRTVQVLLRRVTDEQVSVDGAYGPQTTRVARQFEVSNALGVNGRLTRGEQRLLSHFADLALADRRVQAAAPEVPVVAAVPPPAPTAAATLNPDGTATPPPGAPPAVAAIIAAGNEIASKPYRYGGGHRDWIDTGYDCSGSVSYALHGAGLLAASAPSGAFETWGDAGPGTWATIYARKDHMFLVVAGLRFDTSGARPSRWQTQMRAGDGYVVRHPSGL